MSEWDPDGWFTNPADDKVMGPARQLAAEKVSQYRAYHARRDHMNRIVTTDTERARLRRAIALRVLASLAWLFRESVGM